MLHRFRRLLPRSDTHLLLWRDLATAAPAVELPGVRVHAVTGPNDPGGPALDAFAAGQGFPAGWAVEMLRDSSTALAAVDTSNDAIIGMAWATRQLFHVGEIGAPLDPRGGVYLFGDFVSPTHRGRGLQRLLVSQRLSRIAGVAHAYTIIHPSNVASVRSYEREGFVAVTRFTRYCWWGRTWARCAPIAGAAAGFVIDASGAIVPRRSDGAL